MKTLSWSISLRFSRVLSNICKKLIDIYLAIDIIILLVEENRKLSSNVMLVIFMFKNNFFLIVLKLQRVRSIL